MIFIEVILKINYYKSIMVYDLRVFMGWEEILMSSVTKRISMVKQPYGGYLNKNQFDVSVMMMERY